MAKLVRTCALLALLVVCGSAAGQDVRSSTFFDSRQLLADLRALSADDMEGRQVDTPGGARARAYVMKQFEASGISPFGKSYTQEFTFTSARGANRIERHGVNVVGYVEGTGQPRRYIVVSAHYDHLGVRNGQIFHGADDNASGTAALFAIAKYFSAHRPSKSLIFVAFDAEETGLQGSQAFVRHSPVDAGLISIDLNADMIGRDPDSKLFVSGTFLQPSLKLPIERVAAKAPVKLLMGHDDPSQRSADDWTRDSDQYSFIQAHIPALYFGVEDYGQHHKPTDVYETMNHDFYIRAVETLILVVQEFDR
jgi:Zn-dependent M28 family amino/carboxypeptidase